MKLSIIVPAYNVGIHLKRCIESCQRQNISVIDYEVIIVNDGSTDNTIEIANELAVRYENVRVISQENKGLSGARNTGIENAKGDYLWFVDGDDFVKDNILDQLLSVTYENKLDLCVFHAEVQRKDGGSYIHKEPKMESLGVISGEDAILMTGSVTTVWKIIYKRTLLLENNLRFVLGLIHQDVEFDLRVYYFAKRVKYIPLCCYEYCYNEGSLSRPKEISKIQRNLFHDLLVMSNIHRFVAEQKGMGKELKLFYNKRINSATYSVIMTVLLNQQLDAAFLRKLVDFCKEEGMYPFVGNTESWKTTILSKVLNFEKLLFVFKKLKK